MTPEQKAKAYDEALKRAREWHNDPHITIGLKGNLEDIFPELKESEDERIRKEIIETFKNLGDGKIPVDINYADIFTWLEKQGGQKFAWSEEDEEILRTIISDGLRGAEFDMLQINWLKSLKQRIGWKPSEEQIECLHDAINHYQTNGYPASKLNELYEQMSKIYKL